MKFTFVKLKKIHVPTKFEIWITIALHNSLTKRKCECRLCWCSSEPTKFTWPDLATGYWLLATAILLTINQLSFSLKKQSKWKTSPIQLEIIPSENIAGRLRLRLTCNQLMGSLLILFLQLPQRLRLLLRSRRQTLFYRSLSSPKTTLE